MVYFQGDFGCGCGIELTGLQEGPEKVPHSVYSAYRDQEMVGQACLYDLTIQK